MTGELTPLIVGLPGVMVGGAYLVVVYFLPKWRSRKGVAPLVDARPASFHFITSKATVSVRPPPWSRPILRIRSVWRRRVAVRPIKKRHAPELRRCLDKLIRYSGKDFPAKVTAREIEQSNALLVHLDRACHVLDQQGKSHPKIEKNLVLRNVQEWIDFLSKLLARKNGRTAHPLPKKRRKNMIRDPRNEAYDRSGPRSCGRDPGEVG